MTVRERRERRPSEPIEYGEEQRYGQVYDPHVMRRLWLFLWPYRYGMGCAALCMIGGAASQLLAPYVVKRSIDEYIATGDAPGLTRMVLFYIGIALAGWLLQYGDTLLMTRVAQRVLLDLRQAVFRQLMRLELRFYDRTAVGQLMSRVQNDVSTLQDVLTTGLLGVLGDLLLLVGILAVMISMHVKLTLVTCTVLPISVLLTAYWRRHARRLFRVVRVTLARVNTRLQENIAGVRVIQSLVSEDHNLQRFIRVNDEHLAANLDSARMSSLFFPAMEVVSILAIALVVVYGGPLALAGEISAGTFVAFVLYMNRFFEPIRDLGFRWSNLQMAMASGERIFQILDTQPDIREAPSPVPMPRMRGDITLEHVHFSYQPESPVLCDISLQVPAGQNIAIVGPTGAGKTTLINLLARFYDVTSGAVRVDGVDVRQIALSDLRRQMGMVLQEPFLFSGTVRDNIRYGRLSASDADIEAAAKAIGIHDRIMQLARGYDTPVHERGALLSHGQRQLISFVRALLADPRLLILDEATASIDTETERLIQSGLATLLRGRTAFIIAHRLSTVKHADRIVVLEQGRLVESGSHETLMQQQGLYYRLHRMAAL
jgi:ABC-type multidrug transport system fused ATPase/permease subunit